MTPTIPSVINRGYSEAVERGGLLMMDGAWGESVGDIIVARVRGLPSEELLRDVQDRVVTLLKDTQHRKVLYDALELVAPSVEVTLVQQGLTRELDKGSTRIAVVVPNTRVAYLAR